MFSKRVQTPELKNNMHIVLNSDLVFLNDKKISELQLMSFSQLEHNLKVA